MKLAINGGNPVRTAQFPRFPVTGVQEERAAARALRARPWNYGLATGVDAPGRHYFGRDFEERFAAYHGARYAIVTSTGSLAVSAALSAAGVGPGDEVIFQAYTCFANVDSVVQVGGVPVLVDIDPASYCIDVARIEEKISSKTAAIVAIHWAGRPSDMDAIRKIARKHKLAVIEDAAVAHGAEWRGRKVGTLGNLGAFSFGCGKLLQCGEGGIIITNNKRLAEKCHHIRNRGRNTRGDAYMIGWNGRMSEILAAVLIEQLKRYPRQLKTRTRNAEYLARGLQQIPGLELPAHDPRITQHACCFFFFKFKESAFGTSRAKFIEAMAAEGIPLGGPTYPKPVYRNSFFQSGVLDKHAGRTRGYRKRKDYVASCYPEAEKAWQHEALWLPHGYMLGTKKDMTDIVSAAEKVRENVAQIR